MLPPCATCLQWYKTKWEKHILFYRPLTKFRQGHLCSPVCLSVSHSVHGEMPCDHYPQCIGPYWTIPLTEADIWCLGTYDWQTGSTHHTGMFSCGINSSSNMYISNDSRDQQKFLELQCLNLEVMVSDCY